VRLLFLEGFQEDFVLLYVCFQFVSS